MLRTIGLLALCLPAIVRAQTSTRTLTQEEMGKFHLIDSGVIAVGTSKTAGNVVRFFGVEFFNDLPDEVESVDIRFSMVEDGKTLYEQNVRIGKFYVYPLLDFGGGVPDLLMGIASDAFPIDQPAKLQQPGVHDHLEITTVRAYVGDGDLHDVGHLYSWLKRTPEKDAIQRIKDDPSIAKASNPNGMTALGAAYAGSTLGVVKAMLAAGAEFKPAIKANGWVLPAVLTAAVNEKPDVLSYLVEERGLPIDALSSNNETPLYLAYKYGRVENARWLLHHGANPNAVDLDGKPPSFHAVMLKDRSGLDDLKAAGANLRYHDPEGYGLMQWTASRAFVSANALAKVQSLGVSIDDAAPKFGLTPLMAAVQNGRLVAVRWLIARGADLSLRNADGSTALDYARKTGNAEMRKAIEDAMAKRPKKPA